MTFFFLFLLLSNLIYLFQKLNELKVQRLNIIKIQFIKQTCRKAAENQRSYHQAPYNYKNDLYNLNGFFQKKEFAGLKRSDVNLLYKWDIFQLRKI